jgi:hypothetical protein
MSFILLEEVREWGESKIKNDKRKREGAIGGEDRKIKSFLVAQETQEKGGKTKGGNITPSG